MNKPSQRTDLLEQRSAKERQLAAKCERALHLLKTDPELSFYAIGRRAGLGEKKIGALAKQIRND